MGLDSDRDGRAFLAVDLDRDGDLDLALKNRNTPQLVILRNDRPSRHHAISFKLLGERSNRDAVGAAIRIVTEQGSRTKFVRLGSGFLSQSSTEVFFGLGPATEVREVTITWPSGQEDHFQNVAADQRITVREGASSYERVAFTRSESVVQTHPPEAASEERSASERGSWLVEPVPAPDLTGTDLDGQETTLVHWRGRPLLLNFWATWCAPCQQELAGWRDAYGDLQAAGAEIVAVSVDEPGSEEAVRRFVAEKALPFPVLLPAPASVHAYNIFHRNLLRRPRDLQIPTTYLLDAAGEVIKVYRGITPPDTLLRDLKAVPGTPDARWHAALPYPGRQIHPRPGRDYVALAFSFMNAGLPDAGQPFLARALPRLDYLAQQNQANKLVHLYRGVARLELDQPQQAREALEQAVQLDASFSDAQFNLGVAYSHLGLAEQAIAALQETVALDPGFADAYFNLAILYRQQARPQEALVALQKAALLAPDDPDTQAQLGVVQAELGMLDAAIESLERAVRLQPHAEDSWRNLGVLYYQKGWWGRAAEALEQAHRLAPNDPDTSLPLAVAYLRTGRMEEARSLLEATLAANPQEERARQLLQEIDRLHETDKP